MLTRVDLPTVLGTTNDGSAAPVALPLSPRSSVDFCDDINYRRLFDIVWSCLATIFACTWMSVHPNVPPPDQSWLALFWRRLRMMLIGIIAPEVMMGFAARQFWVAGILSKKYGFSRTHGYFFCMGGFVSSRGYPVATEEQLDDSKFGPGLLKTIRSVDTEDILDNSVALVQGLWFTTQCLARMHQHLAVTALEVATLAFAVVNIFIWLLWWDKPLDVQRPMVVGPPKSLDARPITPAQISRKDRFLYAIIGSYRGDSYVPVSSTSVLSFYSPPMDDELQFFATMGITALAGSVFAAIHCAAWNTDFPTAAEMWIWRSGSLIPAVMPVVIFLTSFLMRPLL
ncbi:hypothetical protein GGX14DRAFT_399731 [Mycena pura]|uniref:Uncharacterized protein n=1 Tax=Mycena pura TaxID=153505 RepID=A0AAD6V810_9AGAR|nr:hypothetical protein GGX14DRAFT_399731 [Mycena pura]